MTIGRWLEVIAVVALGLAAIRSLVTLDAVSGPIVLFLEIGLLLVMARSWRPLPG